MKDNKQFQNLLQKYFLQWLITQRNVSPETVKSYRDSFRLFIRYLEKCHKTKPSAITVYSLEAEYILGFLDYLKSERGNQAGTINNRLSAINSFLRFLSFETPEYSGLLSRSLMIPYRKEVKRQMDFLTKEEYQGLLNSCDLCTSLGCRDKLMLLILYNTGCRVSELVGIKTEHIIMDVDGLPSYIRIHGKGRKERDVPLWKTTAAFLRSYLDAQKICDGDTKLFVNRTGDNLTRSGVRYRLCILVKKASEPAPSLNKKTITPHSFRHTAALNLLQSGVDISTIAIWLGHESILTTHKYMEADMEMKRNTLEKIHDIAENPYQFRPDNAMLSFLDSL